MSKFKNHFWKFATVFFFLNIFYLNYADSLLFKNGSRIANATHTEAQEYKSTIFYLNKSDKFIFLSSRVSIFAFLSLMVILKTLEIYGPPEIRKRSLKFYEKEKKASDK